MKVLLRRGIEYDVPNGAKIVYRKGEYNVEDELGQKWIAEGLAVSLEPEDQPQETESESTEFGPGEYQQD